MMTAIVIIIMLITMLFPLSLQKLSRIEILKQVMGLNENKKTKTVRVEEKLKAELSLMRPEKKV